MIVITDSSIIVSSLIRPKGQIASIFAAKSQIQFIAPSFLLQEIKEHLTRIKANTNLSPKEFNSHYKFILSKIQFSNLNNIPKKYILQAYEIVKDIDENDTFFVALHQYTKHKIWTTDKALMNGLLKKGYNICITTATLRNTLYKK